MEHLIEEKISLFIISNSHLLEMSKDAFLPLPGLLYFPFRRDFIPMETSHLIFKSALWLDIISSLERISHWHILLFTISVSTTRYYLRNKTRSIRVHLKLNSALTLLIVVADNRKTEKWEQSMSYKNRLTFFFNFKHCT